MLPSVAGLYKPRASEEDVGSSNLLTQRVTDSESQTGDNHLDLESQMLYEITVNTVKVQHFKQSTKYLYEACMHALRKYR